VSVDILGLGAVAVDDLLYLEQFPKPDSKMKVVRRERHPGGHTGTALAAAARLGRRCSYAGALGDDELSRFALERLAAEGIGVEHLVHRPDSRPFHSTILVDMGRNTRTILWDSTGVIGADPKLPAEEAIEQATVLFVDHVGLEGMVRAALVARASGIPIVADFERRSGALFNDLEALADHPILSLGFAQELTGATDGKSAVRALWTEARAVVVVTGGADGAWYATSEDPGRVFHQPAFPVEVVDTNGCGDAFHGAYAAALAEGMAVEDRLRFASAVAALKATQRGGQQGLPRRPDVERFLGERSGEALPEMG
jgi:sulfofructose kinase